MRTLAPILILSALAAPALATPAWAQQAPPSAQRLGLRYLTWPGKVAAPQPRQVQVQPVQAAPTQVAPSASLQAPRDLAWSGRYRPVPHGPNHFLGQVTPAQRAAIDQQRAEDRDRADKAMALAEAAKAEARQQQAEIRQAPLPAPALPSSIYAPPPPGPVQAQQPAPAASVAAAGGYDQHARFYSLHRPFGQKPDPVTLSPQFLATPSADLADPPPPPAPRILPGQTATAAQQTAARVAARDSSD